MEVQIKNTIRFRLIIINHRQLKSKLFLGIIKKK